MTKIELIELLAKRHDLTRAKVCDIIEDLSELVVKQTRQAGQFRLHGIGTFRVVRRKAYTARKPSTGEPVKVPAGRVVRFSAARAFRDGV